MKIHWNRLSGKPHWPVVGAILFLASCANADSDISHVQADESIPTQVVINGTFQYSERGEILHELHAGELSRQEKAMLHLLKTTLKFEMDLSCSLRGMKRTTPRD